MRQETSLHGSQGCHTNGGQKAQRRWLLSALFLRHTQQHCPNCSGSHIIIEHPFAEVNLSWTIYRELFEELFGGKEVEKDLRRLRHNWYFKEEPMP